MKVLVGKSVVKADGRVEAFNREKLKASLVYAGVSKGVSERIARRVEEGLPSRASSQRIFREAYRLLLAEDRAAAARYRLKQALMELGPPGYPFEKYVAEILRAYGYRTSLNLVLEGRCGIRHEIDVVAEKKGTTFLVECKHHRGPGGRVDLQVALYVYARFLDLQEMFDAAWLFTNTKFTMDAVKYAGCVGMRATGWRYPEKGGLEVMISETGLYPVTVLSSVVSDGQLKSRLLDAGVVTLARLVSEPVDRLLALTGLPYERLEKAVLEARTVLS